MVSANKVQDYIEDGYEPYGDPIYNRDNAKIYQAVILREEELETRIPDLDKYFEKIPPIEPEELPPPIPSVEITEYKGMFPFGKYVTRGMTEEEMSPGPRANPPNKIWN